MPSDAVSSVRRPDGHSRPHPRSPPRRRVRLGGHPQPLRTARDRALAAAQGWRGTRRGRRGGARCVPGTLLRGPPADELVLPRGREDAADGARRALEGLARADGPTDERDGEGPPGGVRRRHAAPDHPREHAGPAAAGDGEPRQGAADTARAGPLGRGAAPECGRGCRPARPLRLPGAGLDARRRGLAAPSRPRRPDSGRQAGRRRRQGAPRGVPGRLRGGGRRRAQPLPGRSRTPGARPPRQARPEVVLATVRAVARLRDHVRPRRDLHSSGAGAGQHAERGRLAARGHSRLPVDPLHPAPHGRGHVAAGDGRTKRPRGARARARAVHAARQR